MREAAAGRLSEDNENLLARVFFGAEPVPRVTGSRLAVPEPAPAGVDLPPTPARASPEASAPEASTKPTHYRVVSISLYTEDLERMDRLVKELKAMGHTKASRSSLIRYAIDQVDITGMPRGY
jgi:hypothetical protein